MIDRNIILDSFEKVRANTVQVARDIPEDKYDFRPVEGVNTVMEHFKKILNLTEFMVAMALYPEEIHITAENRPEWLKRLTWTDTDKITTQAQVAAALEQSIIEIRKRVMAADDTFLNSLFRATDGITKVRLWVVQCAKEQEMTMRAQLYLYERHLGIIPHTTRRQLEKEAARKAKSGG